MFGKIAVLVTGGALGTLSRYFLQGVSYQIFGTRFPYGTVLVNGIGCFLIGFIGTLAQERFFFHPLLRLFLMIGLLGGFTTYSSFAFETFQMAKDQEFLLAIYNAFGHFFGCFVTLIGGVYLARLL